MNKKALDCFGCSVVQTLHYSLPITTLQFMFSQKLHSHPEFSQDTVYLHEQRSVCLEAEGMLEFWSSSFQLILTAAN